jgi:hypothetical protein
LTAYSLRSRAGFVSHRRRSWDSPFGAFSSRKVSMRFRLEEPTYRFTRRYTRASPGRHDRLRFLGFDPSGNPWRPNMLLTRRPLDAPLGLLQPHPRPQQAASPREATRFRGLLHRPVSQPFDPRPGRDMCSPHATAHITMHRIRSLAGTTIYRSCRDRPQVPSLRSGLPHHRFIAVSAYLCLEVLQLDPFRPFSHLFANRVYF